MTRAIKLLEASLLALALATSACGNDSLRDVDVPIGGACDAEGECVTAAVCLDGRCRRACDGDAACGSDSLVCDRGGCMPRPVRCGDSFESAGEECDDGNLVDGDGCSSTCRDEAAPLTYAWAPGEWSACSNTCGEGVKARTVTCRDSLGNEANEGRCGDAKPATLNACEDQSGCTSCSPATCAGTCVLDEAGEHEVRIPAGCRSIRAQAWGGGGAGGNQVGATGGGGAFAAARIPVTAGETITASVAQGGTADGHGGGASMLERGESLLLVAAGGGGGGSDGCSGCKSGGRGGAGGAQSGEAGGNLESTLAPYCTSATGGKGGTQAAGGAGGTQSGSAEYRCNGEDGSSLKGGSGNGARMNQVCHTDRADGWRSGGGQGNGGGGGGGAGYFGGGGAGFIWTYCAGGGGGGSSWSHPENSESRLEGGSAANAGNSAQADGAGRGGARQLPGASGKILIEFVP